MTILRHKNLVLLLLAFSLTLAPVLRAQEAAPEAPVKPVAPEPRMMTAAEQKPVEPTADDSEDGIRELTGTDETVSSSPATTATGEGKEQASANRKVSRQNRRVSGNERVSVGSNSTLGEGERADVVVSIFGSSTSAGEVDDAVVSILGGSRVTGGTVGDTVVSILGNTYINGHVKGEVVTILGNVELGPNAVVDGELVCIGGQVTRDAAAVVKGGTQHVGIAGRHINFDSFTIWISECLLYARPLAWNHHLLWAWCVALAFLGFYALIALIAPAGVVKCVETLEQRPGYSLLSALLALLLTPVAYILLVLTLAIAVGFVLIPLFSLGLFFMAIFGKIVMLAWLGRRFTKLMGNSRLAHPAIGVLIGGLIILGLYTIPIAGFIIYKLLGILGLGVVVYTLILQFKASRPVKPVGPPVVPTSPVAAAGLTGAEVPPPLAESGMTSAAPPVISAATLSRAGFWVRLGASLLDFILLWIVTGVSSMVFHGWLTPGGSLPFWFAVYCVAMWATKGTTIGGIICGLKVVRLDDRPIDWGVAAVRGLGGFLSLVVAGLGFIWVAFDDERQSWHDKIAGTTIVKVPKGTSLI